LHAHDELGPQAARQIIINFGFKNDLDFYRMRKPIRNDAMTETQHPLRFHVMKVDDSSSQRFTIQDSNHSGDCHAYDTDEAKTLRPLSYVLQIPKAS
jgi:hypothetical protein